MFLKGDNGMDRGKLKMMSDEDLERLWLRYRDDLFEIRHEMDRRKDEPKPDAGVDFTQYVTK